MRRSLWEPSRLCCMILITLGVFLGPSKAQKGVSDAPLPSIPQAKSRIEIQASLGQLMRSIFAPHAIVIFDAPERPKSLMTVPSRDSDLTPEAWEAIENSAIALIESTNLIVLPGRKCENGKDVPVGNADWDEFVEDMRTSGMMAFEAALVQRKGDYRDAVAAIRAACANCHERYREANRAASCQ
jgi:hypothetical protein